MCDMEDEHQQPKQSIMQTYSYHFTSRILSNWQRAHASFRKKVKQWNKVKNVNTCLKHLTLCHERIVHGAIFSSVCS